jgi:hypothetical protein
MLKRLRGETCELGAQPPLSLEINAPAGVGFACAKPLVLLQNTMMHFATAPYIKQKATPKPVWSHLCLRFYLSLNS